MLRLRSVLAVYSVLASPLAIHHVQAAPAVVRATFDVRLGPLLVGRGNFEAQVTDQYYAVGVSAKVTGVARLLAGGEGSATARGALHNNGVTPTLYHISNTAGSGSNEIRLLMRANQVVNETVVPPIYQTPDRVPLTDTARRGVVDPLSAFVFPVAGNAALASPASCERTLKIFDGRQRYDIALSYSRTQNVRAGDYEGPVLVCKAKYTPIAGHRKVPVSKEETPDDYQNIEAWLMPVNGTRALVLYRMEIGTPAGALTVQAQKVSILPGSEIQQETARAE